jgi:hypothetical protein
LFFELNISDRRAGILFLACLTAPSRIVQGFSGKYRKRSAEDFPENPQGPGLAQSRGLETTFAG